VVDLVERGGALSIETTLARRLWLGPSAGTVRRRSGTLSRRALVIGDPTGDLPAATAEAAQVEALLRESKAFPAGVVSLIGPRQATAGRVSDALAGGGVDLLHYAGHALATEDTGGLALADDRLRPDTLAAAVTTPVIVVANACSTGEIAAEEGPRRATFVTSLTRAGVDIFLGCAWPVGDVQARTFSQAFYGKLLGGEAVGVAVNAGRRAIQTQLMDPWDPYWAAYVLYGNPWYRLVEPPAPPPYLTAASG